MNFYALGLMSGTSLDGLDICHASFKKNALGKWTFEILHAATFPYSKTWENRLRNAIHLTSLEIFELHTEYGFYLGEKAKQFIENYDLKEVDFFYPNENQHQEFKKIDHLHHEEETKYQKLWQRYFFKTNIPERKNLKMHHQMLPKRYWKYLTEKS